MHSWIKIGSEKFSPERRFRYPSTWQDALKAAYYAHDTIQCLCHSAGVALNIKHYKQGDHFGISRIPNTGHKHARGCEFYVPNPTLSGMCAYKKGVIASAPNGVTKVKLTTSMRKPDQLKLQLQEDPTKLIGIKSLSAMSELGLTNMLIELAGFNKWYPSMKGKRSNNVFCEYLYKSSCQVSPEGLGDTLDGFLVFSFQNLDSEAKRLNLIKSKHAQQKNLKQYLLAEIEGVIEKELSPSKKIQSLKLAGEWTCGIREIIIQPNDLEKIKAELALSKTFPVPVKTLIAAIITTKTKTVTWNEKQMEKLDCYVDSWQIIRLTEDFIPVEDVYDATLTQALVSQNRSFIKILNYDSKKDPLFADFEVLDTSSLIPMEIIRRSRHQGVNPYPHTLEDRIAWFDKNYGTSKWWVWNTLKHHDHPSLPDKES